MQTGDSLVKFQLYVIYYICELWTKQDKKACFMRETYEFKILYLYCTIYGMLIFNIVYMLCTRVMWCVGAYVFLCIYATEHLYKQHSHVIANI